jgi:Protein  of unknown function (DUF3018)
MRVKPTSRFRTARYRDNLRRLGLRPVQIWIPDTRSAEFRADARRQCERVNSADRSDRLMDWAEGVSALDEAAAR